MPKESRNDGELCSYNVDGYCIDISGQPKCGVEDREDCSVWTDQKIPKSKMKEIKKRRGRKRR